MKYIMVTNNPKVYEKYNDKLNVDYKQQTYKQVLIRTRDMIHSGHKLLTHPLSGSVKPNETVFKTIIVSEQQNTLDLDSLRIIEQSLETAKKFGVNQHLMTEDLLNDFGLVDLSLIESVIIKLENSL
ncbi:MAG: Uncharacterized protein XD91_0271 [Clostridiales bacterium 38_11]|nr:MAG: Uncharacterized protein XD91_0271 [Clostridiales bacterium 38_11]HBH13225.1 GrdX protein [Clostridiales bacterium]